jgi:hypothetical protein
MKAILTEPVRRTLTPRQFAQEIGVDVGKVLSWIRSGELTASNLSERPDQQPRWKILREDAEAFLKKRSNAAAQTPRKTRRRKSNDDYERFDYS